MSHEERSRVPITQSDSVNRAPSRLDETVTLAGSGQRAAETSGIDTTWDSPGGQRTAPASRNLPTRIGSYELLEEIARGGMGVVYKARHLSLKRTVALKMILAGQFADDAAIRRFYAEAAAAAKLDHPNIVAIYEVGEQDGQHYLAMAYVKGQSLAARVADSVFDADEAARMVGTIASAVSFAHCKGVIHRDLKPGNVLLDEHGEPRITDFGLAKQIDADSGLTGTGQILGTPSYMPPEQARGEVEHVSTLSDVYSLGATLYCLLTGRPPFKAATAVDTLLQVMTSEPVSPRQLNRDIPLDLETICLKCLEKEPARRYASAEELANELRRFRSGEPIVARPLNAASRTWRWCRRNPQVASLLTVIAVTLLLGVAVSSGLAWLAAEKAKDASESADTAQRESDNARTALTAERKAREESLDTLCRAYFDQARAVRLSGQPGRRWIGLALLKQAQSLRTRDRRGVPTASLSPELGLPTSFEMRNEALACLLLNDAREVRSFSGSVFAPAFSAGGTLVAIRRLDAAAANLANGPPKPGGRLVDVRTGQELGRWEHEPLDHGLHYAISLDGKWLAGESRVLTPDKKPVMQVKLWELPAGEKLLKSFGWPGDAQSPPAGAGGLMLAFSSSGRCLAALRGRDVPQSEIAVWDVASGEPKLFARLATARGGACFSRDERLLAAFDATGSVTLWNLATGAKTIEFKQLAPNMNGLAFGAGDEILAAVGSEQPIARLPNAINASEADRKQQGYVMLLSLENPGMRARLPIGEPADMALAFDPEGRKLAVGERMGNVTIVDCKTNRVARQISGAHTDSVFAVHWLEGNQRLVTAGFDGQVKVWELSDEPPQTVMANVADSFASWDLDAQGKHLAVFSERAKQVFLFDLIDEKVTHNLAAEGNVRFRRDGKQLAVLGSKENSEAILFDVQTGNEIARRKLENNDSSCAFSADGDLLIAEQQSSAKVSVWNVTQNRSVAEFDASIPAVAIELSPDGRLLAFRPPRDPNRNPWRPDGLPLRVCELATGRTLFDTETPEDSFFPCRPTFSPDGRWWAEAYMWMAAGDEASPSHANDNQQPAAPSGVLIWETATGRQLPLIANQTMVTAMAFSPDGKWLALANRAGVVSLHQLASGKPWVQWTAGLGKITRIAFTADGNRLVAGDGQSSLQQLDLAKLRQEFANLGLRENDAATSDDE